MALYPLSDRDHHQGAGMGTQAKSLTSMLAIASAVGSFFVDNAAGKFSLAILAVILGLIGMIRAASPRVSGGILSIAAILIAVVGLLVAILDAIQLF